MRTTQIHCVEQFWMQVGPSRLSPGLKKGPKGALDQKFQFCHGEKFLMDVFAKSFSDIVIDPKGYFLCDFNQIEDGVFEKSPLFGIPYFGQKLHFFGPEGPILTQNLKNIV